MAKPDSLRYCTFTTTESKIRRLLEEIGQLDWGDKRGEVECLKGIIKAAQERIRCLEGEG